ncbi:MAG: hypothetical protein JSS91_10895 [Bacteroidetes bacterium]|nr:hypothetical protein [Bacteroidota bacterium]
MKKNILVYPVLTALILISGCGTKGIVSYESGLKLFQEKKYNESVMEFQQAVKDNPEFGEAYMYLGRAYNSLQKYDLSIENYQKALGLFKQDKFNVKVDKLNDKEKITQVEEVWLPYSQLQQKIQKGIPLTDIEIQKQEEIIKKLDPK